MKKRFVCVEGVVTSNAELEAEPEQKSQEENSYYPPPDAPRREANTHSSGPGLRHPWMRHRRRSTRDEQQ